MSNRFYIIALFFCFGLNAFAQTDTSQTTVNLLERDAYTMEIPAGWRVKEGCIDEKCVMLSPADTLSSYDRFTENISITINKLTSPKYTADMYATFSTEYLPKVVSDFTVLERKRLKPNVVRLIYRGKKDGYEQTWMQYYYVKNVKVYIITFSMQTPNYDYYRPLIEPYIDTFKLK